METSFYVVEFKGGGFQKIAGPFETFDAAHKEVGRHQKYLPNGWPANAVSVGHFPGG